MQKKELVILSSTSLALLALLWTSDSYPRQEFLAQKEVIGIVSTIALSILGVAVWKSGSHSPSKGIKDLHEMSEVILQTHIQNMIKLALQ